MSKKARSKASYVRAIDAGDVDAMCELGRLFHDGGDGVTKDAPAQKLFTSKLSTLA
eukprot:IDg22714t1